MIGKVSTVVMPNSAQLTSSRHLPTKRAIISRGLYIFPSFFNAVYIVERLKLQTIYVLNEEILQFLDQKAAVKIESGY